MATREFDLILWGATGFTGELVLEYLVATYGVGQGLNWAIGGRSQEKLEAVRAAHVASAQRDDLPLVLADSDDPASIEAMVGRTKVVCSTVGPYAKYGTPLVAACARLGTDYCDLTGEVQWMAQVIREFEETAAGSGARIVHTCGFDSVPFDMGNWYVQQLMHQQHGVYGSQVKGRVGSTRGGASGGTIASILNMMEEAGQDETLRKLMADPYLLYPAGVRAGQDGPDQTGAVYDDDFGQWTSPFVMAAINTRVVRRSNALLGFPWGENFRYDESLLAGSRLAALRNTVAGGLGMLGLALKPTRKLLSRVLPKPGDGPSKAQREAGHYQINFLAINPADRTMDTAISVSGELDPGYGSTSRMLGEAAVCLAQGESEQAGGFWTPAAALGQPYLDRLTEKAGLTFEIIDPAQLRG